MSKKLINTLFFSLSLVNGDETTHHWKTKLESQFAGHKVQPKQITTSNKLKSFMKY